MQCGGAMTRTLAFVSLASLAVLGCATHHDPVVASDAATPSPDAATCVPDATRIAGALSPDLTVRAHVCASLPEGPIAAARRDGELVVYALRAEAHALGTELSLERHRVGAAGLAPSGERCAWIVEHAADATLGVGRGIGLSPAGTLPHVGVNVFGPPPDRRRLPGHAFVVEDDCTVHDTVVEMFGGSTLLSDDPSDLVIMGSISGVGTGLFRGGEQIAYAGTVGSIARWTGDRAIAAISSGHGAVSLSTFAARDMRGGPFPIRGVDSEFSSWPLYFEALEGRGLAGRAMIAPDDSDHMLFAVPEPTGGTIAYAEPTRLASSLFTRVVPVHGSREILFRYEGGIVVAD